MEESRWLSALTGSPVLLKCENLQRTGSFKVRGAYTRMSHLSEEERARGVVAASAGNHAQGVALAAQFARHQGDGLHARGRADPQGEGDPGVRRRRRLPRPLPRGRAGRGPASSRSETGAVLIHPFDSADVVAGQGTVGLEILEQAPDVETVVVPCGGGGLLAGIAIAVKAKQPGGHRDRRPGRGRRGVPRLARGRAPGRARVDDDHGRRHRRGPARARCRSPRCATSSTRSSRSPRPRCRARCWRRWSGRRWWSSRPARRRWRRSSTTRRASRPPTVGVLSGGNIDPLLLGKVIQHGMAAAGRYLNLQAAHPRPPGRPGPAARASVGEAGANVIEVPTRGSTPTCRSTRSRCTCSSRRAGRPTPSWCSRLRERGYRVFE